MMKYLCLVLFGAAVALAASVPQWPSNYLVEGSIELAPVGTPHVVFNNFSVYYDSQFGGYQSFDNDETYTVQSVKAQFTWVIMAAMNQYMCIPQNNSGPSMHAFHNVLGVAANVADMAIQPGLPDLTNYTYSGEVRCPHNEDLTCDHYQKLEEYLGKPSSYDLYTLTDGTPIRWEMLGVNEFQTSHYDHYIFNYRKYLPGYRNMALLQEPAVCANKATVMPEAYINRLTGAHHLHRVMPSPLHVEFQNFTKKHGKQYQDENEYDTRMLHFTKNFAYIQQHNEDHAAGKHTFSVAVNHFADKTHDEMRMMTGLIDARSPGAKYTLKYEGEALPDRVDWREKDAVTPVKDQGMCGSCWSFSTTGSLESIYYLQKGKKYLLSEQYLVDCAWNGYSMGCAGGNQWAAYQYIQNHGGIPTTNSYGPYKMINEMCHYQNDTAILTVKGYVNTTSGDENALMKAIAMVGPVAVSIDATYPMYFYHDGVYYLPDCKSDMNDLDHAVLAVGYGTENGQDYWLVKNSWSTFWGHFGYIKMSRKNNNCGVATSPLYPLV